MRFDANFIALHLPQVLRLFNQMLMHRLTMRSALGEPGSHRAFVESEGGDNRLHRTAVSQQGQHQGNVGGIPLEPVKRRPFSSAKRLLTNAALEALFFLRMHTDVAFTAPSSGKTSRVRTKCIFRGEGCNRFWFHTQVVPQTPECFKTPITPRLFVELPNLVCRKSGGAMSGKSCFIF